MSAQSKHTSSAIAVSVQETYVVGAGLLLVDCLLVGCMVVVGKISINNGMCNCYLHSQLTATHALKLTPSAVRF